MTLRIATAATLLLLLPASALAQTTPAPAPNAPPVAAVKCPTPGTVADADLPAECKTQSGSLATKALPKAGTSGTSDATDNNATGSISPAPTPPKAAASATPVNAASVSSGYAVLASDFIGQTVYTANGDNAGDISDLVMNRDLNNNILAVVGVGGFLGMGKKDVAIALKDITVSKDADKRLHLTINMSKAQLDAAQAFDRTALR